MIKVSLYGGLGNQLFQYAAGLALALRMNEDLLLDLTWFDDIKGNEDVTLRKYALTPFELDVMTSSTNYSLWRKILFNFEKRFRVNRINTPYFHEKHYHFDQDFLKINNAVHLNGYWQSYRYFQEVEDVIRENLGVTESLNQENSSMLQVIERVDAICLHVRRGDYVSNQSAARTHGLCDLDYYASGLKHIAKGLNNPHCFLFSDDPDWVKNNMNISTPFTIVDINGPDDAHLDLWLMAACNHFVIANSTLSWWAAWLGKSIEKIVVAPKQWFVSDDKSTKDLIPESWVRL